MYSTLALIPLFFTLNNQPEEEGNIVIDFSGIKTTEGYINLNLYNSEKGFPNSTLSAFKTYRFKVENIQQTYKLANIPYGNYAISCYQDINTNGELDTNFFGIPKEPVGSSNTFNRDGIPNFNEAQFKLERPIKTLQVNLN